MDLTLIIKKITTALIVAMLSPQLLAQATPDTIAAKNQGIIMFKRHDRVDSQPYLKIAANSGDPEAQYFLGEVIRLKNLYMTTEARRWYEAAATQGHLYAMLRLSSSGDLCVTIGTCDEKSGEHWKQRLFKIALERAEKGDTEAMMVLYKMGESLSWLQQAAVQGNHEAQRFLAVVYEKGEGWFFIPGNRQKAVEHWAKASAEGGDVRGMYFYADFLFKNDRPKSEVGYWLKKTAEAGHLETAGSYAMNIAHMPDSFGYPLDLIEAYAITYLIAQLESGGDARRFSEKNLPLLAEKMTPEEIQQAIAYSKEWEKTHPPLSYYPPVYGY